MREKARQRYSEDTGDRREERNAYQREYVKNNREAIRENKRRYREKNREKLAGSEPQIHRDESGELNAKYRHTQTAHDYATRSRLRLWPAGPAKVCDACGGLPDKGIGLHFDHCHTRGHFRGWICRECNLALGNVRDDPARSLKLVAYLKRTKDGPAAQFGLPGV